MHTPASEQESPFPHTWQLMPDLPQAVLELPAAQPPSAGSMHPEQPGSLQKSGGVRPVHAWAPRQVWHCAPALPQLTWSLPERQAPLELQQPGQVAEQGRVLPDPHTPLVHLLAQHSPAVAHAAPVALQLPPATQNPNWQT